MEYEWGDKELASRDVRSNVSASDQFRKEYGFYNQQYCGCEFRCEDRRLRRKPILLKPVEYEWGDKELASRDVRSSDNFERLNEAM